MKNEILDHTIRNEATDGAVVFTDEFDNGLWLSVQVHGASTRAILTRSQALALIESIQFALSAGETA
jgi:hypothetical protein